MLKYIKAKYVHWQASLLGATLSAFGLGALVGANLDSKLVWAIIIIGVAIHGWGMYKMYKRKD